LLVIIVAVLELILPQSSPQRENHCGLCALDEKSIANTIR
jgi:hypothetical protein